jgi:hypothetical protein
MTTATKLCDLCQQHPAQWRWWVRDNRKSPIARLMDLCHACEELDSVHVLNRTNMPISEELNAVSDARSGIIARLDALIEAAMAEGSRDENARLLALAEEAKTLDEGAREERASHDRPGGEE